MHTDDAARARLIVALDVASTGEARTLIGRLDGAVSFYKIGLELAMTGGLDLARDLAQSGHSVFLDMKFLDIGHTVERAVASAAELGVTCLTIHGHDRKTLSAAVAGRGGSAMKLLAVTVLTNLTADDLAEQGISDSTTPADLVLHRARMAEAVGFDGVIASGQEAGRIRAAVAADFLIVTPGIRLAGTSQGDQERVMTPDHAIAAGADYIVVGRPVTRADDLALAARTFIGYIEAGLSERRSQSRSTK
ncbi:MAG: orotidine-5'-phosphate decarboxylase [Hyphomicrobiaceae bacterium]|nr:orotidine-5'-phosphate decarboxylase [Hyphomicrobiaceae bacterium]